MMAANDVEGLGYNVIDTPEKYWLAWREPSETEDPFDRALTQLTVPRGPTYSSIGNGNRLESDSPSLIEKWELIISPRIA
jgi:hypothetical protein